MHFYSALSFSNSFLLQIIGKKIVERFFNQEDCLIYRCVCYGPPKPPTREEQTPKALNERHLESDSGMRGDGSTKGSVSRPGSVRLEGSSRAGRMSVDSLRSRTRSRVMSRWQGRYSITFLKPRRNVSFLNPYFHVYGCKHNHSCSQSEQQEQTVNCFIR